MSYGVVCIKSSEMARLWLWHRPADAAPNLSPCLGTSICCRWGSKKKKVEKWWVGIEFSSRDGEWPKGSDKGKFSPALTLRGSRRSNSFQYPLADHLGDLGPGGWNLALLVSARQRRYWGNKHPEFSLLPPSNHLLGSLINQIIQRAKGMSSPPWLQNRFRRANKPEGKDRAQKEYEELVLFLHSWWMLN